MFGGVITRLQWFLPGLQSTLLITIQQRITGVQ